MSNGTNAVLYAWGLFLEKYSAGLSNDAQVQQVTGSGFTTVILWTLHVRPNGDLVYNDPAADGKGIVNGGGFNPAYTYLVDLVRALKRPGSSVTRVVFGIGSGGKDVKDFTNIFNLIQQGRLDVLQRNFEVLAQALGIDGFDLDNEDQLPGFPKPPDLPRPDQLAVAERMATFTLMLHKIRPTVTYGVYTDLYFWLECLRRVYLGNTNRQAVGWMNLQCYAGGEYNDPAAWVDALRKSTTPLGIPSPAAFVVPGYWVRNPTDNVHCGPGRATNGDCPLAIRRILQLLKPRNPGMTGAFIWNSFDVFRCMQNGACLGGRMAMADYARAVIEGLM